MKIWLINPSGPIPTEKWREYRFTIIANAMVEEGHEVIWWTSNFSHHFKKYRSQTWQDVAISSGFTIRLVPTNSYKKNISFGRILKDVLFGLRTYNKGKREPKPDLIIFAENPLCFGFAGAKLANYHQVPAINDQMDLWPELFENVFPKSVKKVAHYLLKPVYANRKSIYSKLSAFISLAQPYLDIPAKHVPEIAKKPHAVIYNGIDVKAARAMQSNNRVELPIKINGEVWAIFAGSLGPSYDIPAIIEVAERFERNNTGVRIFIVGDGPYKSMIEGYLEKSGSKYLHYLGFMEPESLAGVYSMCDIGLASYTQKSNVEMPDKFYDFTAAGLAIINSLRGEVSNWISKLKLGYNYVGGDADDLYEKIKLLVDDSTLLSETKKQSYDAAMLFDKNVQIVKLKEIVGQLPLNNLYK